MIYIVTALKPEAQAFVDKFKLCKGKCKNFTTYSDNNIILVISGVGVENARIATKTMIQYLKPNEDDILVNIGICGANKQYVIGELLEINTIIYNNNSYLLNKNAAHTITCVCQEINTDIYDIVDMESFGFYEATKNIKNLYMYKIVSDNFKPETVTKEKTKSIVFNNIEEIMKKVRDAKQS